MLDGDRFRDSRSAFQEPRRGADLSSMTRFALVFVVASYCCLLAAIVLLLAMILVGSAALEELVLIAIVAWVVLATVALPFSLRTRRIGLVIPALVPLATSVCFVIYLFTVDWQ